MNREIKFRAWAEEDKVMFFPLVLGWGVDNKCMPLYKCKDGNRAYKDYPLMQFTGLKDKNGKEIYEGDIIANNEFPSLLIVGFNIGCASFCASKTNSFSTEKCYWFENDICVIQDEWEVVGNIYENSELLND